MPRAEWRRGSELASSTLKLEGALDGRKWQSLLSGCFCGQQWEAFLGHADRAGLPAEPHLNGLVDFRNKPGEVRQRP